MIKWWRRRRRVKELLALHKPMCRGNIATVEDDYVCITCRIHGRLTVYHIESGVQVV